jgi:FixJ family two-component response regulator
MITTWPGFSWRDDIPKYLVVGVDDDFRVRESIESLVESAGYASQLFSSAEDFMDSGALAGATCLITDVRMPGMDGLELQRQVRLERPQLPIIFISAHYDDEIRQRAFDGGAIEFMYKPFDASELLRTIDRALTESLGE